MTETIITAVVTAFCTGGLTWLFTLRYTRKQAEADAMKSVQEVYQKLTEVILDRLANNTTFAKKMYHYMLLQDMLDGYDICNLMYDQNLLTKEDDDYAAYVAGNMTPFQLLSDKIAKLEITPAQLALDPCSGSAVITDPNTGAILACVSYPGYDNNLSLIHI